MMSDLETLSEGLGLSEAQLTKLTANLHLLKSEKLLELDSDVARSKEGMHITKTGLNVLAKAMTGKELRYSRVAFGDAIRNGSIVEPTDAQILNYTSLIHERDIKLPIADVRFSGNGTAVVTFQVNNSDLATGFWARELGIFVIEPDTGAEILYAYKNTGALSTYIPGGGGAVALNLMMNCVTIVDQATNVTANIDADLLFVSQTELLDHVNSATPHPNVPNLARELTTTNYIWVGGSDTQLHPMSAKNLQAQILGDNLESLSLLKSRVSQTEINLANLFTQLNAEKELGLAANLLLVEDFLKFDTVDRVSVQVRDQTAGTYSVCVDSIEGLLEGHYYTISDGLKSQYVRIQSLSRKDDLLTVIFEEKVNQDYEQGKTWLYRTTGLLTEGSAGGSSDVRSTQVRFADEWKGESSTSTSTLTLATTQTNAKNFTLDGDYSFTANGEFTLS